MVAVYLTALHPTKIELIPNGTTVSGVDIVNVPNNTLPADFYMNYNTYMYTGGVFVRDSGITINNNMNTAPVYTHNKSLIVANNTPVI